MSGHFSDQEVLSCFADSYYYYRYFQANEWVDMNNTILYNTTQLFNDICKR